MFATIRDTKGQGNTALYVRVRDATARFWNFTTSTWVTSETANCRVYLTEYQDADTRQSRYQNALTVPAGEYLVEYVRVSDSLVIGEEDTRVADIANRLTGVEGALLRVRGLLTENSIQDQQQYDTSGRLTGARIRCYDSATLTTLLRTYTVTAEYTNGSLSLFKIVES